MKLLMNADERRQYYRAAADRWIEGARLQTQRCLDAKSGDTFFDSNFLVVAVVRLREIARMAGKRLRGVDLAGALGRFDAAHPELRDVRDYQEHILAPALIGTSMYSSGGALVRLCGDGRVETLVDPPQLLEDAERLHTAICDVLGQLPHPGGTFVVRPPDKKQR